MELQFIAPKAGDKVRPARRWVNVALKNFYRLGVVGGALYAMRFQFSCIRLGLEPHTLFFALTMGITKWHFKILAIIGVHLFARAVLYPIDSVPGESVFYRYRG